MPINEKIIMSSDDNSLILTSKRVKHEEKSASKSKYKSIPIDQVATCALNTRSFPVLLVLAVLTGLVIIGLPEAEQRILAGVVAVALVVAYFLTRKGQIEIFSTSGESIAVPTKGLSHDQVKQFLEAVESQYHNSCGSSS
ncbi:MAG: hypothetical protein ACK5Q1_06035 [Limnobacter sp.]|jgi:hypothetical protein